jgi:hypothetical protein
VALGHPLRCCRHYSSDIPLLSLIAKRKEAEVVTAECRSWREPLSLGGLKYGAKSKDEDYDKKRSIDKSFRSRWKHRPETVTRKLNTRTQMESFGVVLSCVTNLAFVSHSSFRYQRERVFGSTLTASPCC